MSYNKSPLAFDDIKEVFERALNSAKGVKIACKDRGAAVVLRSRFNYYRKADRSTNMKIYPDDHPMWNKSPYDRLVLQIPAKGATDENILYIVPRSMMDLEVEDL